MSMQLQPPPVPENLQSFMHVDMRQKELLVDPRRASDPLILTWLSKARQKGIHLSIVPTDLDVIADKRSGSGSSGDGPSEQQRQRQQSGMENQELALRILRDSAERNASDIHIHIKERVTEISIRVKGERRVLRRMSVEEGDAICRAYYQGLTDVKDASYTPRSMQNAQISGETVREFGLTSVRIVRGPSFPVEGGGAFMVLRLQYGNYEVEEQNDASSGETEGEEAAEADKPRATVSVHLEAPRKPPGTLKLPQMGYSPDQVERLRLLTEATSGMVLFTGPVGSGKTTTIYELAKEAARLAPGDRMVSIEKPVEYPMPWAIQLSLTGEDEDDEGTLFMAYFKHVLRMDPDSVFVSEIRSAGVAITALEAALTGAKVLSTMHTFDPYAVPDRIEILDSARLPKKMFCNSKQIRGIVNQRLVPQLCSCALPYHEARDNPLSDRMISVLGTYGDLDAVRVRGPGCPKCQFDGVVGRSAVAEVIVTDPYLMEDFIEHGADAARQRFRAREDTDPSMMHTAIKRALQGEFDPRDVARRIDVLLPRDQVDL